MTTQLRSRERSDADLDRPDPVGPEVLFEEARRRRRRRWMVGGAVIGAVAIAGALVLGNAGGGGHGAGGTVNGQPSRPGPSGSPGSASASRAFPGAPSGGRFYTGPGASCTLAPHNRYLPAWSGCVSTIVADVFGNGHRDLVITYSRLGHVSLGPPPAGNPGQSIKRYPARQAMLRVVSPDGHMLTAPVDYRTAPLNDTPAEFQRAAAAALIAVAHVSNAPGKQIFLQTGQISSGSSALAYSLYHGRLVASGVVLGYGGDAGDQAGFECIAGNPPRLIQRSYALIRGIRATGSTVHIYGWWTVTTTTYAWRGPRLVELARDTAKRRVLPSDTVGAGCIRGIA